MSRVKYNTTRARESASKIGQNGKEKRTKVFGTKPKNEEINFSFTVMRLVEAYCFPLECILPLHSRSSVFVLFVCSSVRWVFDINQIGSLAERHIPWSECISLLRFLRFSFHFHVAHSIYLCLVLLLPECFVLASKLNLKTSLF